MSQFFVQCSSCSRMRINDENDVWIPIDEFKDKFPDYDESEFSHGICLKCAKQLYPKYYESIKKSLSCNLKIA